MLLTEAPLPIGGQEAEAREEEEARRRAQPHRTSDSVVYILEQEYCIPLGLS